MTCFVLSPVKIQWKVIDLYIFICLVSLKKLTQRILRLRQSTNFFHHPSYVSLYEYVSETVGFKYLFKMWKFYKDISIKAFNFSFKFVKKGSTSISPRKWYLHTPRAHPRINKNKLKIFKRMREQVYTLYALRRLFCRII